MPQKYSVEALARRRERAERLGFLQPGAYIAVPRPLKERAKAVVKSIVVHAEHNSLNKRPSHYARVATHHAAHDGMFTEMKAVEAQNTHRCANSAKHEWHVDTRQRSEPWVEELGAERPPVVHGRASVLRPRHQSQTLSAATPVSHDNAAVESLLARILKRLDCIEVTLKGLPIGGRRTEAFEPLNTVATEPLKDDEQTSTAALEPLGAVATGPLKEQSTVATEPLRDDERTEQTKTATFERLNTVAAEPLKGNDLTRAAAFEPLNTMAERTVTAAFEPLNTVACHCFPSSCSTSVF